MKAAAIAILAAFCLSGQIVVIRRGAATVTSVAYDATANTYSANSSATSCSFSITIGSGSNRGAVAFLSVSTKTISSISATLGGAGMTAVSGADTGTASSDARRLLAYGIANPASGSQTVAFSWTTGTSANCGAVSFTGVNQTTPFNNGTFTATNSPGAGTDSLSITSTSGDRTVDAYATSDGNTPSGNTQTLRFAAVNENTFSTNLGVSTGPGTGTTSHGWANPSSSDTRLHVGVNVAHQ